jgi:CRP-like cAMP-binding protein
MDTEQWRLRLATGHWFSHLPAPFQHSLLAHARQRQLEAGQYLFKRGDPPCGLYAVLNGSLRVSAVNAQGKEAILSLVESPYWFGEICLFDGLPRTHDACAVGPCTLLQVPQQALLGILDEHPRYWRDLALLMSQKLRLSFIGLEQLSLMPAPVRLAHRLWRHRALTPCAATAPGRPGGDAEPVAPDHQRLAQRPASPRHRASGLWRDRNPRRPALAGGRTHLINRRFRGQARSHILMSEHSQMWEGACPRRDPKARYRCA